MHYDYTKRGYLLPNGCKDLIDVLKLHAQRKAREEPVRARPPFTPPAVALPPVIGELVIREHTTVLQLASSLNVKPVRIIAALMDLGIFTNLFTELDFETIATITRRYGYIAKKAI